MSTLKTISSREFNQDVSGAKQAAEDGPVFITDRDNPTHVLLTVEDYYRLLGTTESVANILAMPECAEIEFGPTRTKTFYPREVDLS